MNLTHPFLPLFRDLSLSVRTVVQRSLLHSTAEARSRTTGHAGSDVIYAIDREVEEVLLESIAVNAEALGGVVLIAEGVGDEEVTVHPAGWSAADCAWRLLVDPIDGTRGIMMNKRSAWFLAGAAPNRGPSTCLQDIECAVMAELPTSRAALADVLLAVRGQGLHAETVNLFSGETTPFTPAPWSGDTIRGGFAQICRFFPPGREHLAALEETLIARLFPDALPGEILSFEDQYISTGGQLAELITGKDRFTADLRATLYGSAHFADQRIGHVCHPYDLAAVLVAEEAGVVVTGPDGGALHAPMDTRTASDWIAYANPEICREVAPVLLALLQEQGWA